ncbi:MAG: type 2 isopentenyl-diphosphate Delta-isomerase [Hyphomicrobiaceae bacterium]
MTSSIEQRKSEHVEVVLTRNVGFRSVTTGFEAVRFEHVALPELSLDGVDTTCRFLGRTMRAPLIVSSMTGGPARAESINIAIARACNRQGVGFGVGSQRIALESGQARGLGRNLRDLAPDVPILANFGAAQIARGDGPDLMRRAIEMIDADGLIIHLNPVQEAVQSGGDTDWRGLLAGIERLARATDRPIVVKEVGFGISGAIARRLWDAGIAIIDVAGAGGTNWAAVEAERATDPHDRAVADGFRDWGIPTLQALEAVRAACPQATIIASGGIRDGVDVAKAIRMGADLAGLAAGVLAAADDGEEALAHRLGVIIAQLRIVCFATASADLTALRHARLLPATP